MPRPELPTMDLAHNMTFASKLRGIHSAAGLFKPQSKKVLALYRAELRRAEKFVVDDDAVRLACHLAHERDKLKSFSFLARLPFDVCWLEYSLHTKVQEFNRMNGLGVPSWAEVPHRAGVLLYKDDPGSDSPRWVATQFLHDQADDEVFPAPLSFVFDPEGNDYDPVRGSKRWRAPTLSLMPGFPRMPIEISFDGVHGTGHIDSADAECLLAGDLRFEGSKGFISDQWTMNRAAVIADPFWRAQLTEKHLVELLRIEVREEIGQLRWLMTLLAAINHLPKEVKPIQTRIGRRTVGANILPYFQHRTISIKLPKDDRIVWARKHLASALRNAPRAWHRVSGHWRIVERGKTPKYICRHLPTMVEQGLGMCERCQLMIRWIPDHHRGDPTVGIVEHTYAVTAK